VRRVLEELGPPDHLGLAYDVWTPTGPDGKVPNDKRPAWLARLVDRPVSPDYAPAFMRWRGTFQKLGDRTFELTLATRLLVGRGTLSGTDVGLTVHHTWGVPIIPGSALKGLGARYVDTLYGPDDPMRAPWEQPDAEQRQRARWQGITWRGRRIDRGPGDIYRSLFGGPEAESDAQMRDHGLQAGALSGLVTFHDALYVPGSAAGDRPYAPDVLTVHQKRYYDSTGRTWPSDYDDPNPIAFLTVRPGTRMLLALSGPPDWTALADQLLRDALEQWGVGGKTSAGYGRLVQVDRREGPLTGGRSQRAEALRSSPRSGDRVEAVLLEERTKRGGWKARHEPSGVSGPIQNSGDVPPGLKPGDRVELVVASVSAREVAFRFPTLRDAPQTKKKGGK
jgi:CRISPR-associated protein Cmr6